MTHPALKIHLHDSPAISYLLKYLPKSHTAPVAGKGHRKESHSGAVWLSLYSLTRSTCVLYQCQRGDTLLFKAVCVRTRVCACVFCPDKQLFHAPSIIAMSPKHPACSSAGNEIPFSTKHSKGPQFLFHDGLTVTTFNHFCSVDICQSKLIPQCP